MSTIAAHHQRAIARATEHFRSVPGVQALILAGSIAKGQQTDVSDVDMMAVLDEAELAPRRAANRVVECLPHLCDYEGGYVDVKYLAKAFLRAAADHGSEPTRNSFGGARCLFAHDPEIPALLARVPVYPRHLQAEKFLSFYAALTLNSGFFWGEAQRRQDPYLRTRAVSEIALYGCRLLLAHNERLFPSQKRLREAVLACPALPADFPALLDALLTQPSDASVQAFTDAICTFRDWGVGDDYALPLTRYIDDHEQWWHRPRPYVPEW